MYSFRKKNEQVGKKALNRREPQKNQETIRAAIQQELAQLLEQHQNVTINSKENKNGECNMNRNKNMSNND